MVFTFYIEGFNLFGFICYTYMTYKLKKVPKFFKLFFSHQNFG